MISEKAFKERISELYHFRHMFYSLVRKSLFGKYKNSALGFLWNFITPAISILIFYIVFESFMGRDIPHYWAYLCVGMFPFTFMNTNLIGGASNITSNGGMIKKMYFPREILPLSQVAYTLIVFLIAYSIVAILMLITGFPLSSKGLPGLLVRDHSADICDLCLFKRFRISDHRVGKDPVLGHSDILYNRFFDRHSVDHSVAEPPNLLRRRAPRYHLCRNNAGNRDSDPVHNYFSDSTIRGNIRV